MSPLRVEAFHPVEKEWVRIEPELKPGDPSGSMSNNNEDGSRDLYLFECADDDSKSIIYRSGFGTDVDLGAKRVVSMDPSKLEVVKELKRDESYEMEFNTDQSPEPRKVRFTHR